MGYAPVRFTTTQKKQLVVSAADFQLIVGQLYKMGPDEILRRCVLEHERPTILNEVHDGVTKGHNAIKSIVHKIIQVGLWWPNLHGNARDYYSSCDICQRTGKSI